MFAAAVDAREGFFVQQAVQIVFVRHPLHDVHHHLVLVARDVRCGENGRKFVLGGRRLVMLGLGENA